MLTRMVFQQLDLSGMLLTDTLAALFNYSLTSNQGQTMFFIQLLGVYVKLV